MSERKCNNCKIHYWIDTDHCQSCGSMNTVIVSDNRTLADYDFNFRGQIIDGDCRTLVTNGSTTDDRNCLT